MVAIHYNPCMGQQPMELRGVLSHGRSKNTCTSACVTARMSSTYILVDVVACWDALPTCPWCLHHWMGEILNAVASLAPASHSSDSSSSSTGRSRSASVLQSGVPVPGQRVNCDTNSTAHLPSNPSAEWQLESNRCKQSV